MSTYLHLIVCYLEYPALQELLSFPDATDVIRFQTTHITAGYTACFWSTTSDLLQSSQLMAYLQHFRLTTRWSGR